MTCDEFLSNIKSRGAKTYDCAPMNLISATNTALQQRRRAMLPMFLNELFMRTSGITLGNGCIFAPTEIIQGTRAPIPTLIKVNDDMASFEQIRGKTIFGRNDLFWFAYDAFGTCYMLDNIGLRPLRKYDDAYRAISDCLLGGKI
ncbi:MAG: hypothetical protein IKW67_03485 [Alphaproteobacteria bacterium]|nr:hypothetical protein [Alphaproteobacteria bacterium]